MRTAGRSQRPTSLFDHSMSALPIIETQKMRDESKPIPLGVALTRQRRQLRESDRLGFPLYHHGKFSYENKQGTSRFDLTDNNGQEQAETQTARDCKNPEQAETQTARDCRNPGQ